MNYKERTKQRMVESTKKFKRISIRNTIICAIIIILLNSLFYKDYGNIVIAVIFISLIIFSHLRHLKNLDKTLDEFIKILDENKNE